MRFAAANRRQEEVRMRERIARAVIAGLALSGIAVANAVAEGQSVFVTSPAQPMNVGDAITAAAAYHDSGAYDKDVALVAGQAAAWIAERAGGVAKPAVVFDIDETALANWEVITRDNFGRPVPGPCDLALDGPCGWAAWDQLAADPAIGPTLDLFKTAMASKAAVFFITGRPEDQRTATEKNLRDAGYAGFEKLYMVPPGAKFGSAADFKTPVRAEIEAAGYTIIANIGDQPSDLLGGHAERIFLLPNPFYRVR
jgi:predicted secreted acid phosphatase